MLSDIPALATHSGTGTSQCGPIHDLGNLSTISIHHPMNLLLAPWRQFLVPGPLLSVKRVALCFSQGLEPQIIFQSSQCPSFALDGEPRNLRVLNLQSGKVFASFAQEKKYCTNINSVRAFYSKNIDIFIWMAVLLPNVFLCCLVPETLVGTNKSTL